MAIVLIFNICLLLTLSRVESCSIPHSLTVFVPRLIYPGHQIATVEPKGCDSDSVRITSEDPSFRITERGAIEAQVPVQTSRRTFYVVVEDSSGTRSQMKVQLQNELLNLRKRDQGTLKRSKRRWSPPPFNVLENEKGPFPRPIEYIVSDSSAKHNVYYTISGPGVDQDPVGVFSIDRDTGMLSVHKTIDREQYPSFTLLTKVFDRVTHQQTDLPLDIHILIDDENDNTPTFSSPLTFTVPEHSAPGTVVGKVNTTDRDQEGTKHVKIKYSLLSGHDRFAIHKDTGVITSTTNTLDRETQDKYLVIVQIKDFDGDPQGRSNTGTATITVTDINDNPPTFLKPSYAATVEENVKDKLILRIPVEDKDLINTPNWLSKFIITKGNEKGHFRMDTDPKTNDGLLYVSKPLNHEEAKNIKLEIQAQNEAPLSSTSVQWQSAPVEVTVTNVDEGPEFAPPIMYLTIKENTPNDTVIGQYKAVDPETKNSDGIKYYKVSDPASWINVDKNNGDLKIVNTVDRESQYVTNGIYNITVKAVDASSKTGTGTVVITVEDENDNVPVLPTAEAVLCEREGELGQVVIVARDDDQPPNSAPFSFSLPSDKDGNWVLGRLNDTAATLKHTKELPTGIHEVPVTVTDLQGKGGIQIARVRICQCRNGACLDQDRSMALGPLALLAMLLPLALLLLLCVLLAFFCATKREKLELEDTGDSGGILLKSNTEAPGEEVDSSLINVPMIDSGVKGSVKDLNAGWLGNKSASTMGGMSTHDMTMYKSDIVQADTKAFYSSQYDGQFDSQYSAQQFDAGLMGAGMGAGMGNGMGNGMGTFDNRYLAQDSSFLRTWQTNGGYLQQKLGYLGTEDGCYADDIVHNYKFEGVGSAAGSVGCCSEQGDNDNLDFLNTLGPKFKTLAELAPRHGQ